MEEIAVAEALSNARSIMPATTEAVISEASTEGVEVNSAVLKDLKDFKGKHPFKTTFTFNAVVSLNYSRLTRAVINIIKDPVKITELYSLLTNLQTIKNTKREHLTEISFLLKQVPHEQIISVMLGRVLRIWSNHNLMNSNSNGTNLAIDLAAGECRPEVLYLFI